MKLKDTCSLEKSYDQPRQHIKRQRHYFANKDPSSQRYGFSSSHVWMWELNYKESWTRKNWCFWTVVLKTFGTSLECKEIQPVPPKWNQFWIFIGRTDAEAESPIQMKSVLNIHWTDWCWSWISNTLASWCEEPTHLKRPWRWERFKAGGEGDNRGWDGWMASLTQWTWVWVNSGSWWWTGRPVVLQSMGSQIVRQDWATELNWTRHTPGI